MRLGRAIVFVHQHDSKITSPLIRARIEVLLLAGKAMDFAARLRGHGKILPLTGELALRYASFAGLGQRELTREILPALKAANVVDYSLDRWGNIGSLEEFVGVSASVTQQTVAVMYKLHPAPSDVAFLHSVEIGAICPLAENEHLGELVKRGLESEQAREALQLTRAAGINQEIPSAELSENVVFNAYVWGTRQVALAQFMRRLPSNERDVLLAMSEQFLYQPGISVSRLHATPALIRSARNAGLVQTATVRSASGQQATYAFSPLLETEDNQCATTEALHQRKLFTAHILFGHESADRSMGRIGDPLVIVDRLISRGRVGPATNIGTDYHLLEAAGIVTVEPEPNGKAFLRLVKPEIAEASLAWLRRITDMGSGDTLLQGQKPAAFSNPEDDRTALVGMGETDEVLASAVQELRKEVQRAARRDDPWA